VFVVHTLQFIFSGVDLLAVYGFLGAGVQYALVDGSQNMGKSVMDVDDLEPIKKIEKKDFDRMSIEDLEEYIEDLRNEIKHAETAISGKGRARLGAEAVFKS